MANENSISKRPRRSESEIEALLSGQVQSGLSVKDFCKEHDVARGVFYHWRSKYAAQQITPGFIPIDLRPSADTGVAFAEIIFPGNRVVRLFRDVDPSYLKAVLTP